MHLDCTRPYWRIRLEGDSTSSVSTSSRGSPSPGCAHRHWLLGLPVANRERLERSDIAVMLKDPSCGGGGAIAMPLLGNKGGRPLCVLYSSTADLGLDCARIPEKFVLKRRSHSHCTNTCTDRKGFYFLPPREG